MKISLIAAVSENNTIGNKGSIPWYMPADLKHFKDLTMGHTIIMGQTTHESIGRALPGRTNIILSFDKDYKSEGCFVFGSIPDALDFAEKQGETEAFIIGGASIYKQTIDSADRLYITKVLENIKGDTKFPKINSDKWKMLSNIKNDKDDKNPYDYNFLIYEKNN